MPAVTSATYLARGAFFAPLAMSFRDRFVIGVIRSGLGRREGEPGSLGRYVTAALATVMGCDGRFCRRAHTVRPPPIGRLWRN